MTNDFNAQDFVHAFLENNNIRIDSDPLRLVEVVSARRGAILAQICTSRRSYALKISHRAVSSAEDAYDQRSAIDHEAKILEEMGEIADCLYVADGDVDDHRYLISRWYGDISASTKAKELRANKNADHMRSEFMGIALAVTKKIVTIHESGYLHGDLQPVHFLFPDLDECSILIDWALGRRENGNNPPYKGAFMHFVAPEVAAGMLQNKQDIPYTNSSELYSLGAVLFTLYTGKTIVNYGPNGFNTPFSEKLERVSQGIRMDFTEVGGPSFPALENVLQQATETLPNKRYQTARQFFQALEAI